MTAVCKVTYHTGQDPTRFCLFSQGLLSHILSPTGSMDVGLAAISPVSLALDTVSWVLFSVKWQRRLTASTVGCCKEEEARRGVTDVQLLWCRGFSTVFAAFTSLIRETMIILTDTCDLIIHFSTSLSSGLASRCYFPAISLRDVNLVWKRKEKLWYFSIYVPDFGV